MTREELIKLLNDAAQGKPAVVPMTTMDKLRRTPFIEAADKAVLLAKLSTLDEQEQAIQAEHAMILAQRERRWNRILKQLHESCGPDKEE